MPISPLKSFIRQARRNTMRGIAAAGKYSPKVKQIGSVISVPNQYWQGLEKWQNVKFPLTNLVTNGDFSNGTTGWSANCYALTATNKEMSAKVSVLSSTAYLSQNISLVSGHKYYFRFKILPKFSTVTSIYSTDTAEQTYASPAVTANIWNTVSLFITPTGNSASVRLYHRTNTGYQLDDVVKFAEISAYDMSVFANLPEPTLSEMDAIVNAGGLTLTKGNADLTLYGQTLKNELNYNPATWSEWTDIPGATINNGYITFTNTATSYPRLNANFKKSTKYGILLNIKANTRTSVFNVVGVFANYPFSVASVINAGQVGNAKYIQTTQETFTINSFIMNQAINTGTITFGDIRIFELPASSQIEADFTNLTADQLAVKYPYVQGCPKNETSYNPNTWAEWTLGTGTSADSSGATLSGGSAVMSLNTTIFKTNTRYGVLFNTISNNLSGVLRINSNLTGSVVSIVASGVTGLIKSSFITQATISTQAFSLSLASTNTGSIKFNSFRIFELPTGSIIEDDFNTLTADELNAKYPFGQTGALRSVQCGVDVKSIVSNGDFKAGTTGWTPAASTLAVNNGIASVTADGSQTYGYINQNTSVSWTATKKLFIRVVFRVISTDCTQLKVQFRATSGDGYAINFDNPTKDMWYTAIGICTYTNQTGNVSVRISEYYADASTANGKVMEVKEVTCIDMGTNASNPLYNKTLAEMQALFPDFVPYGTRQVSLASVKSVGRNLFDGKWDVTGTQFTVSKIADGYTFGCTGTGGRLTVNLLPNIKFKPLTQYTFSGLVSEIDETKNVRLGIAYTDGTYADIFVPTVINTAFSMTSAIGKTIQLVTFNYSGTGGTTNLTYFVINEGTTALPYEPYTETSLTLPPVELRRLPNGVADTFDSTGKLVKRVGYKVLQASDIIGSYTLLTNIDMWLASSLNIFDTVNITSAVIIHQTFGKFTYQALDTDAVSSIGTFRIQSSGGIALRVAKGAYANLASAQVGCAGTDILYQLANPIETQYSLPVDLKCPDGLIVDGGYTLIATPSGDMNYSTVSVKEVAYPIV